MSDVVYVEARCDQCEWRRFYPAPRQSGRPLMPPHLERMLADHQRTSHLRTERTPRTLVRH